jgi:hypothetical protein
MKSYPSTYPTHITCCIWAWYGLEAAAERAWPTLPWILSGFEEELCWLPLGLRLTSLLSEASDANIFTMVPFSPRTLRTLGAPNKDSCQDSLLFTGPQTEAHSRILLSSLLSNKKLPKAHSSHKLPGPLSGRLLDPSLQQWHQEALPGCSLHIASARLLGMLSRVEYHTLVASHLRSFH